MQFSILRRPIMAGLLASLLIASAFPVTAAAEPVAAMTLQEVVDNAVKSNPGIVELQKRWEEKSYKGTIARSLPNPQIGMMLDNVPGAFPSLDNASMFEYSFDQVIMNPAKTSAMGKMADNDALMARMAFREKQIQVYAETKQVYYEHLFAAKALSIGKESQQLMGQLSQIAQINFSTGMTPLQDTLKAQTEFSKMTTDLLNMAGMEAISRAKLNVLMGRSADASLAVAEEFSTAAPPADLAALRKSALTERPAVSGMHAQVAMAESGLKLAKAQSLPDFEFKVSYKKSQMEMVNDTWKYEFMLMVPLWGDRVKAEIRSAKAGLEAAQASLQSMRNMTELDVQMALTEAQVTWRQIELYRTTLVPQAEQTYQAALVGYTNGKVDFMTVVESLNTLRNIKLGDYKARTEYEKAMANLEKATGAKFAEVRKNP